MEEKFVIYGEKPLNGEITIKGSKNAATPILAATLLTKNPCIISNLPLIEDVFRMIELIESLGVSVKWLGKNKIKIQAEKLNTARLNNEIICQLRSSVLFLGPLLARLGKVEFPSPGGCVIGARSLETHFRAFKSLGAKISRKGEKYIFISPVKFKNKINDITLKEFSVTTTENILMFASLLPQKTIIRLAAAEPHIQDLIHFLQKLGVKIEGSGTHCLIVEGKNQLDGAEHYLVPDYIEAGTFLIAIAATRGKALIKGIMLNHMDAIIYKLQEMGVRLKIFPQKNNLSDILVLPSLKLKATNIQTLPYPGLPTDIQAPFGVLATQAEGTSLIHDPLYEGRLRYVNELNKMGANCLIADAHRAFIVGPTPLYGKEITSFDIRAGATLIIAGLIAKGKTIINNIYQVDRGYEKIEKRLRKLGANIKRVKS
jgi:UDP-N-acetylglucosamine 1-carboxyvinyltransferase